MSSEPVYNPLVKTDFTKIYYIDDGGYFNNLFKFLDKQKTLLGKEVFEIVKQIFEEDRKRLRIIKDSNDEDDDSDFDDVVDGDKIHGTVDMVVQAKIIAEHIKNEFSESTGHNIKKYNLYDTHFNILGESLDTMVYLVQGNNLKNPTRYTNFSDIYDALDVTEIMVTPPKNTNKDKDKIYKIFEIPGMQLYVKTVTTSGGKRKTRRRPNKNKRKSKKQRKK